MTNDEPQTYDEFVQMMTIHTMQLMGMLKSLGAPEKVIEDVVFYVVDGNKQFCSVYHRLVNEGKIPADKQYVQNIMAASITKEEFKRGQI